jgi:hypothetical protein
MSAGATVLVIDNPALTKSERKAGKVALKRASNFYGWYLNYLKENKTPPLRHRVIDQQTTSNMREMLLNSRENYDVFLAGKPFNPSGTLTLKAEKVEAGRVSVLAQMSGELKYTFHLDLVLQRGGWRIDMVFPDEDLNPALHQLD